MISGNKNDLIAGRPRIDGFIRALQDHNLPYDEKKIVTNQGFSFSDGLGSLNTLLDQSPDITAIFAASDELAMGAISAAYQLGIKVPDELSIIGYDNLSIAEMAIPPLTSVAQPLTEMGEVAANMLFEILNHDKVVDSRIMPHQIKERNSVKERK
jgi:LacI family transcriptional regulator